MSGEIIPVRKGRGKSTRQIGDVVPFRARETKEDIVAAVTGASKRQSDDLTRRMQELAATLDARHREHAQQLVGIGYAMDRPTLDDFIEIGQRLLAAKGGRFR